MRRFGNDQLRPPMVINMSKGFQGVIGTVYHSSRPDPATRSARALPASEVEVGKRLDRSAWPSSILVDEEQQIEISSPR